jgi:hypothetical protein
MGKIAVIIESDQIIEVGKNSNDVDSVMRLFDRAGLEMEGYGEGVWYVTECKPRLKCDFDCTICHADEDEEDA